MHDSVLKLIAAAAKRRPIGRCPVKHSPHRPHVCHGADPLPPSLLRHDIRRCYTNVPAVTVAGNEPYARLGPKSQIFTGPLVMFSARSQSSSLGGKSCDERVCSALIKKTETLCELLVAPLTDYCRGVGIVSRLRHNTP
ncbi:hypothetical protein, unlikely [Trypanosoma congolense IL3000]|uniref:Uncharacterized protein n=1 Tax=Trypanosoma congolense (strain IL3000) TaxID=1068625 RepID=F9W6W7_TRYCI|nr:hypothetical protein, unlikely [Trypanosoma congolense IL3000]